MSLIQTTSRLLRLRASSLAGSKATAALAPRVCQEIPISKRKRKEQSVAQRRRSLLSQQLHRRPAVHEKKEAETPSVDYHEMHQKVYETRASQSREKGKYVAWTSEMDRCLAKALVEQVRKGNKRDGNLLPAAYSEAFAAVNESFGLDLNKEHVRNRLKTWKKQFGILKEVLAHEGFEWDDSKKMVVADMSAWNEYIKVHPDARQFRHKVVENHAELCVIIGSDDIIGGCDKNHADIYLDWIDIKDGVDPADAVELQSDGKQNRNLRWTKVMDHSLGKIVEEQARKGKILDYSLENGVYDAARSALTEKFGPGLTKGHIRNRLKTWKKQHNSLKEMFSHGGFKWDDTRRIIIANDSVWNDYLKTHPDARLFHGKVVENYDQLCLIFGNPQDTAEPVDASYIQSFKEKDTTKNMMWTNEMDHCLCKILVEQVRIGSKNKLDNKLKPTACVAATSVLNERFHRDLTKDHVRNRLKTWKKQYDLMKELLDHDDFEWDEANKIVVAEEYAWSQFIRRNPDARQLQGRVIDRYDEMCIIFGCDELHDSSSNGDDASFNLIADTYTVDVDYAVCNQSDNTKERGKYISWTEEMDRCLTEQLLEQVLLGNKPDKKFKAIAYTTALSALNEKFELELTKENIVNRLKTWKKQYVLVKELLSHRGFEWDERKKMVLASDSTWNEYIKRNPDSRHLWAKPIENFHELCIIVGNEPANGNCGTPCANAVVEPIHDSDDDVENPIQMLFEEETRNCDAADDVQGSIHHMRGRPSSPSHFEQPCKRRRISHAIGAKVGVDPLAYNDDIVEIPMHDLVEEDTGNGGSGDDIHVSSQQTRAGPSSSSDSEKHDKTPCNDALVEVMSAIATNIGRIADALAENNKNVCLEEVFEVVQNIPGFDDDLILDACEYLSFDDKRARMFMKLNDRLREKWLLKRLRRRNS